MKKVLLKNYSTCCSAEKLIMCCCQNVMITFMEEQKLAPSLKVGRYLYHYTYRQAVSDKATPGQVYHAYAEIGPGRPESMMGAHVKDHNAHSIGICYDGGLDINGNPKDTRTPEQKTTLLQLLKQLKSRFPRAIILGHNTFAAKACPCFRPEIEYKDLQP